MLLHPLSVRVIAAILRESSKLRFSLRHTSALDRPYILHTYESGEAGKHGKKSLVLILAGSCIAFDCLAITFEVAHCQCWKAQWPNSTCSLLRTSLPQWPVSSALEQQGQLPPRPCFWGWNGTFDRETAATAAARVVRAHRERGSPRGAVAAGAAVNVPANKYQHHQALSTSGRHTAPLAPALPCLRRQHCLPGYLQSAESF